jgi:hypothetical protein
MKLQLTDSDLGGPPEEVELTALLSHDVVITDEKGAILWKYSVAEIVRAASIRQEIGRTTLRLTKGRIFQV